MKLKTFLVAIATTLGIAGAAHAREPRIAGELRPITGGAGSGPWTELVATLRTTTADAFHGQFELVELGRHGHADDRVVDRRDLDLAPGPAQVHIPVLAGKNYGARIVDGEGSQWEATVSPRESGRGAVILGFGTALPTFAHDRYDTAIVSLNAMPRSSFTYDGALLFFVSADALAEVDDAACGLLDDWVSSGGTLVVVRKIDDRPLRCGLLGRVGERRTVGKGMVLTSTRELSESEEQIQSLFTAALEKRTNHPWARDLSFIERVEHAPRVAMAAILVVIVGALLGPCLFFHLRRRANRRTRIVTFLAGTSLAGFGAMVLLGQAFAAKRRTTATIVSEFASGDRHGRTVETRVFHAPSAPVRTKRALPGSLLGEPAVNARSAYRVEADGTIVLNEGRPPVSDYVYVVESVPDRLAGPITISCAPDACTIDNASGGPLERARLYVAGRFVDVGRIETKRVVSLGPSTGGAPLSDDGPDAQYAVRSGVRVVLTAWQLGAAPPRMIGVPCISSCGEVSR